MDSHAEAQTRQEVRVHIDQHPYHSPNPTTGEALYHLGRVEAEHDLYREVQGNHEDELIPNGPEPVQLQEDEHFHSAPRAHVEFKIIVNGRQKTVTVKKLTFGQLVGLAFDPPPSGPNIVFTVTYRNGPHRNPEGTMVEGQVVRIKDGMVFNVTATDKS